MFQTSCYGWEERQIRVRQEFGPHKLIHVRRVAHQIKICHTPGNLLRRRQSFSTEKDYLSAGN